MLYILGVYSSVKMFCLLYSFEYTDKIEKQTS